ncbi:MAG TPA: penicillin-binding protein 2 [Polyangiaceae bacterium]|nr:penicillin-binding protein 2 [Polyangiaceae bacterium]
MSVLVQRSDVGEFRRRYKWMVLFTVIAFLALVVRLFQLQIISGDDYRAEARHNIIYEIRLATTRGIVRDSQGKVLAANRPSYNVYVVPSRLDMKETWNTLCDYLRLSADEKLRLEKKLEDIRADKGSKKLQQILIREDISRDVVAALETHAAELRGVDVVAVPVRYYPQGEIGAHALGYMAQIDAETLARLRSLSYVEGDRIGAAGVERGWESYLRGTRGWEKAVVDARGIRHNGPETKKFIDEPRRLDPVPGRDLRLTLDVDLEQAIEKAMRGQAAGAVTVVDVRTGRLLGLFSKPAYDSNELSGGEGVDVIRSSFRKLNVDPLQPMLDKTMSGAYPPGSTFKPFSALAALEDKILDPRSKVKCTGYYSFGRRIFKCMHVHGQVELHEAIVKSCNVYFWHLAEAVGMDRIAKVALDFGLGQKTGVGVNPEAGGRIPTHAWTTLHHKGQFRVGYTLNLAIGQGAATVTVLQLALAYAALANGGTLYQPQIVRAVESSDSSIVQDFPPRVRRSITVRPENLSLVDDALRGVVTEEGGTAYQERLNDVDMSGKTGTAQTSQVRERDIEPGRAWYFNRAHAWFAGFAPAKSPEIAIVVLIEHGGAGSRAAVPVAMQVAREYQKLQASRLAARPATARSGSVVPAGSKKP